MIHVAVGIITNSKGEVLIAKRPAHKSYPNLWEFPGGKVESNETVFVALKREFAEEIGIEIESAHPWFQLPYQYPDRTVLLDIWLITQFQGRPRGAEGQIIQWISPNDFSKFEFPEGNKVIIERFQEVQRL